MYQELITFIHSKCQRRPSVLSCDTIGNLIASHTLSCPALYAFIVDFENQQVFPCATSYSSFSKDASRNGVDPVWDSIPDEERDRLGQRIAAIHSFIVNEIPLSDRHDIIVLEDFHVRLMGIRILVTQKFIPIEIDDQGNLKAGLFIITPSANRSYGHLVLFHDNRMWEYDHRRQSLKEKERIIISDCEMKMMLLSRQGYTVDTIAETLHLSTDTIKALRKRVYKKLRVDNLQRALALMDNYSLWRSL